MNKTTFFLPDTNLLYNRAGAIISRNNLNSYQLRSLKFWKQYGQNIKIPSIVWAEFTGLWFHKNVDLRNYDIWFQNRLSIFGKMYKSFKDNKVVLCNETGMDYQNILKSAAIVTQQAMPNDLIQKIVLRIENTIEGCLNTIQSNTDSAKAIKGASNALENNKRILENKQGKILDGLDSLIVVFAFEYAKKYKTNEIIIVSDDKFMVDTVKFFHSSKKKLIGYEIPDNVSAVSTRDLVYKKRY